VISNFIKQHITDSNKNAKDVLAKAKDLQKNGLYKYTVQYITITLCLQTDDAKDRPIPYIFLVIH
jgi:hypothetical protein